MADVGSGSKGSSSSTTQVDIPQFLQSFLNRGANVATGALDNLQGMAGEDRVAGFAPEQEQAFQSAAGVAAGEGGFLPIMQNLLRDTAQGTDISSFLPGFDALSGAAGGQGLGSFLPPEALAGLNQFATGDVSNPAIQALTQTAQGDFLHGGAGFNAALESATRAAQRGAANAFGGSAGGVGSGLSRASVGQGTADAFANQFAQERQNQLGAAGQLGQFGLAGSNALAGLGSQERGRALNSAGLLSQFGSQERDRQLQAANQLPGAGLLNSDILGDIGGQRQSLEQQRLDSPFQHELQLLAAALGGLPIESLLGQSTNEDSSEFSLGFG